MLKVIAVLLMLIDHIGMVFFRDFIILRYIGRLAMPLFAYCLAVGFDRTHSLKKYMMRMSMFAVISQGPFWMMLYAEDKVNFSWIHFNIGFTFLGALVSLYLYQEFKSKANTWFNKILNIAGIMGILAAATLLKCDYGAYGILLVFVFYEFYILRKNVLLTFIMFVLVTFALFLMGKGSQFEVQLLALPALFIITSIKDKPIKALRHFFYIFYPLHMLVISFIKFLLY